MNYGTTKSMKKTSIFDLGKSFNGFCDISRITSEKVNFRTHLKVSLHEVKILSGYKGKLVTLTLFLFAVTTVVSSQTNITKYKEVVGQAGNEYYDPQVSDPVSVNQLPQPVLDMFGLFKQNVPAVEITSISKKIKSNGVR